MSILFLNRVNQVIRKIADIGSNELNKGAALIGLRQGGNVQHAINFATPEMYKAAGDYWLPDGSVNPTPTDDTAALQAMLDNNLVCSFTNKGYRTGYYTGSLKLRRGHVILAPYSAGSTDITATRGVYLVAKGGGMTEIIDTITNGAGYIKIDGLGLYGVDNSCEGVNRTLIRSNFFNMHVIRCRNGFNRVDVPGMADTYGQSGCHFFSVTACNNTNGAVNTVDSKFIFGRFASNSVDGIQLNTGANDNFVMGTKLDFNGRWGFRAYQSHDNTVITENVDRNGMGGIYFSGSENCRVDAYTQRNGSANSALPQENCHLYLSNCTGGVFTLRTKSGANDDGSGATTPVTSVVRNGTNRIVLNGDLTGCTGAPLTILSGETLDNRSSILTIGAENYVSGVSAMTAQTSQVTPTSTETITITNLPAIADNLFRSYTVTVVAKRSDNGSNLYRIKFGLTMVRSTGSPTIQVSAITEETGTAGSIAIGGTPTISKIGTITTDATGTTLSFPITNQYASANVRTRVHVRPDV